MDIFGKLFGSSEPEQVESEPEQVVDEVERATVSATVQDDIWSVLAPSDEYQRPTQCEMEIATEISSIAGPCIREISEALSLAEINSDVRTTTLLEHPNEQQSFSDLISAAIKSYMATGVAYILPKPVGGATIQSLHVLRASAVKVVRGPISDPYRSITYSDRRETLTLLEDDVVIMMAPGFMHPAEPASPLAQAWDHVQADITRSRSQKLIQKRLPYLLGMVETEEKTSKEQRDDLGRSLAKKVGSDVVVLPGGAIMKFPNASINDAFESSPELDETRICAALNVPPILVGFRSGLERSTYSNYEEARKSFYQETISPLLSRLSDTLTRGLGVDVELTLGQEDILDKDTPDAEVEEDA